MRTICSSSRTCGSSSARQAGVPAFVVFTDATLRAMCAHLPKTREALLEVSGVGVRKCEQYGEEFLALLNTFEKE